MKQKTGLNASQISSFLAGNAITHTAGRAVPVRTYAGQVVPNSDAGWGRLDLASPLDDGPTLITPVRVYDSADSHCPTFTQPQQTLQVYVDSRGCLSYQGQMGMLPTDMVSVMANVTLDQAAPSGGFVTIFPAGSPQPTTSTVNPSSRTSHNFTTVSVPAPNVSGAGQIAVYSDAPRRVVVDVLGYNRRGAGSGTGHMRFLQAPVRVVDMRAVPPANLAIGHNPDESYLGVGPIAAGTVRRFKVGGRTFSNGIPTNATGVLLHITTIQATGSGGYTTVFGGHVPDGLRPNTSTVNPSANLAFNTSPVALQPCASTATCSYFDQTIAVYSTNTLDVAIDVVGYYAPDNPAPKGGLISINPIRVVDTRSSGPGITTTGYRPDGTSISGSPAPILGGNSARFLLAGRTFAGMTLPTDLSGVLANVTSVTAGPGAGYITAFPGHLSAPTTSVSTINPVTSVAANLWGNSLSPGYTGNNGTQGVYSTGVTDVVIDVVGYYR